MKIKEETEEEEMEEVVKVKEQADIDKKMEIKVKRLN
jgi:hypothetical protein